MMHILLMHFVFVLRLSEHKKDSLSENNVIL